MNLTTDRIRALNDELRRNLPNGHAVMTTGVASALTFVAPNPRACA
jgi:membrane-associated phospholipid phosphatase